MAYLVLAYPELSSKDFDLVQDYRRQYDAHFFNIVDPHFTLVFAVKEQAKGFVPFNFTMRCATVSKDGFKPLYHTFLVPDEGYSHLVKLHDKLYSGKLKQHLRLDLDYIPHIGIAKSEDAQACKKLADEWNQKDFTIQGSISRLTIVNYENEIVIKIDEVEL